MDPRACLLALSLALPAPAAELSIDVTQAIGEPFEDAIAVVQDLGVDITSLSLFWDDFQTEDAVHAPKDLDWPHLANLYYPSEGMRLTLTFSVIDTLADRRPAHLRTLAWDDPAVVAAFGDHVDAVLSRMPQTDILSISVGNEVDGHLQDPAEIAAFATFLEHARNRLARWRPDVPVGTKLTASALFQAPDRWAPLLAAGTSANLTYYPLGPDFTAPAALDVAGDLRRMADLAAPRPVYLLEAGFPSAGCGTSETAQAAFVEALVTAANADPRVRLVSLTWLTDLGPDTTEAYRTYYGIDSDCFAAFLGSLGLRGNDGTAKPALNRLQQLR